MSFGIGQVVARWHNLPSAMTGPDQWVYNVQFLTGETQGNPFAATKNCAEPSRRALPKDELDLLIAVEDCQEQGLSPLQSSTWQLCKLLNRGVYPWLSCCHISACTFKESIAVSNEWVLKKKGGEQATKLRLLSLIGKNTGTRNGGCLSLCLSREREQKENETATD